LPRTSELAHCNYWTPKIGALFSVALKLLYWDGTGLCLFAKRLEDGRFRWPPIIDDSYQLSAAQLALLLEGMDWRRTVTMAPSHQPALV
jgi:transposase